MASSQPWRRGSATSGRGANRDIDSRWATSSPNSRPGGDEVHRGGRGRGTGGISRDGFKMARKEVGKKPDAMDMLLSPSRGLLGGDEDESLRNHEVQERFRKHVDEKLQKWSSAHPSTNAQAEARKRRLEELSIILLDFRKLREGVTSSRRTDAFACEAYEASVLLSIHASNDAQLSSSLPPLVSSLHPALLAQNSASSTDTKSDVSDAFARLNISPTPDAPTRAFLLTLHLLHSYLLPALSTPNTPPNPASSSSAHPPLSFFPPALFGHLQTLRLPLPTALTPIPQHSDSHIRFLLSVYYALLRNSYTSLARLLSPSHLPPPPPAVTAPRASLHLPPTFHPLATLLSAHVAALRTNRIWPVVQKAYRFPPDPTAWLSKGLLFEFEVEQEERAAESVERKGRKERVSESWEDEEEQDGQEARRADAARRAKAWVAERKAAR